MWGEPDGVHVQNMEQLHAYDCPQNVTEPQATARISRKSTHVYRGAESGLATNIYYIKHAAHRLVQHTLQVVEIAWTDDSTLAAFFFMCYGWPPSHCSHIYVRRDWGQVISNTGTVSQATKTNGIDRLPCGYL